MLNKISYSLIITLVIVASVIPVKALAQTTGTTNSSMEDPSLQSQDKGMMTTQDMPKDVEDTQSSTLMNTQNIPPRKITQKDIQAKRMEVKKMTTERKARIANMQDEAKVRYEERKTQLEEKKAVRQEKIKEKLTEVQTKRLETLKEQAANLEARFDKTAEFLYAKLERISKHVEERETEGFDLEAFKKKVDAIEEKISATEAKSAQLSALYENIEELSMAQMKTNFTKMKSLSKEIKDDYKAIRNDMVKLIEDLNT